MRDTACESQRWPATRMAGSVRSAGAWGNPPLRVRLPSRYQFGFSSPSITSA